MVVVPIYCNLGITPFWLVLLLNIIMFAGVSSRIISSSALLTAVPIPQDRGAFMSVNSSVQQISGGIATFIAGLIVAEGPGGKLLHYDTLGYVVVGAMLITIIMMYFIHVQVERAAKQQAVLQPQ
jgi:predicted MFS family arabinose efflux permease